MKRQKNKIQQTDFTDKTKSFHAFPPHFQRRSHGKHKKLTFPSIRYKLPGFMTIFAKSEHILMKALLLTGLLFILILPGCRKETSILPLLQSVEELIPMYADSASVLLDSIQAPDELTDKDFAHWCMLCGKVTDEAATGLLPIYQWQRAQQWFTEHGTAEEQAQIDLYLGRAYVEDGEYDKAMQIYADALQLAKEHQAYNVAGYICAYMADLYGFRDITSECLKKMASDPEFAKKLASFGDIFVNDAFGTAHRAHASTEGVAHYLPAVSGFLIEKELKFLGEALQNPERPFVSILGGSKVSDKIGVIDSLLEKVDVLLIGGGMAYTFYKALGYEVGTSKCELDFVDYAKGLLEKAQNKIILPVDTVVAKEFDKDAESKVVDSDKIPADEMGMDIGPKSLEKFAKELEGAKTVVWNGPAGVFEFPKFAKGTNGICELLANLKGATTIIGGGDSAAAAEKLGYAEKFTHVSTGGGASLEYLEGKTLPGIAILNDK